MEDTNEQKVKIAEERRYDRSLSKRKTILIFIILSFVIAISVFTLYDYYDFLTNKSRQTYSNRELTSKFTSMEKSMAKVLADISRSIVELDRQNAIFKKINRFPKNSIWKVEASRLSEQVDALSKNIKALESAITDNPLKALTLPILRKDLDSVESNLRAELTQTRSEMDRFYDLFKWFIGILITIIIAIISIPLILLKKES